MPHTDVTSEVIVPLYRERSMVGEVHAAMAAFVCRHPGWAVRFVDDGSPDGTADALRALLASDDACGRLTLDALARNVGKADAVSHGIEGSSAPLVYFMDGDLAYDPELLVELERALGHADVAIGSRGIADGDRKAGVLRRVMGEGYNLLVRTILGLRFRDTQAGIKGFRLDAARQLFARRTSRGFGFDAELLFIAKRRRLTVAEVPVCVNPSHDAGGSSVRLLRDPLRMLVSLLRIRVDAILGRYRD
jgi:glycosyltransferase involved in cell wall biosynthesis